jgi:hypothetical protein
MENSKKIGIGCLAYIVISAVVSLLILGFCALFPSLKSWSGVIVVLPLIAAIVYWYKNHVMNNYDNIREENTPIWYQARLPIAIALALSLLPSLFFGGFDNGTDSIATLQYKDKNEKWSEISIPVGEATEVAILVSDTTKIKLNGKERILKVASSAMKIFNIDTANTYIRTEVTYGKESDRANEKEDKSVVIKDEFFDVNADYVFKAPETIMTKRRSSNKTRTVVYRMKDLLKEMLPQMEGGAEEGDAPVPPPVEEKK